MDLLFCGICHMSDKQYWLHSVAAEKGIFCTFNFATIILMNLVKDCFCYVLCSVLNTKSLESRKLVLQSCNLSFIGYVPVIFPLRPL